MAGTARYAVRLTAGAERDLDHIVAYSARHDSPRKAARELDHLLKTAATLSASPQRGAFPRDLLDLGVRKDRQTFFKLYRLMYEVVEHPERLTPLQSLKPFAANYCRKTQTTNQPQHACPCPGSGASPIGTTPLDPS